MVVWLLNHYATAPDQPATARHYQFGRELVRRGYSVTVFAAGFSHRTGREEQLARMQLYRREQFDGVGFVWIRTTPYRGNGVRRVINMLSYSACLLIVQTRFPRPDVIVGTTVHPFAALAAYVVARLRGALYIYEIGDLWPQTLVDLGAMREGSPAERILRGIEAFLVKRSRAVISMLPGVATYLAERSLPSHHVVVIPNGTDLANRREDVPLSHRRLGEVLESWRSDDRVIFTYVGAHGPANRLAVILRAAAVLERDQVNPVRVLILGDGPDKPHLMQLAREMGLTSVHFAPPVPTAELPAVLNRSDAGLIHGARSAVHRYGTSYNKLFDYWASRLPVVFAVEANPDPVRDADAGISVSPDDPVTLAAALREIAQLPRAERQRLGTNGRAYVEAHYDLPSRVERLERVLLGAFQEPG